VRSYDALNRDHTAVRKQMLEASERHWALSQQLSSKELNLSQVFDVNEGVHLWSTALTVFVAAH